MARRSKEPNTDVWLWLCYHTSSSYFTRTTGREENDPRITRPLLAYSYYTGDEGKAVSSAAVGAGCANATQLLHETQQAQERREAVVGDGGAQIHF